MWNNIIKKENEERLICLLFKTSLSLNQCLNRGQNSDSDTLPLAAWDKKETMLQGQQTLGPAFSPWSSCWVAGIRSAPSHTELHGTSCKLVLMKLTWTEPLMDHDERYQFFWWAQGASNFQVLQEQQWAGKSRSCGGVLKTNYVQ